MDINHLRHLADCVQNLPEGETLQRSACGDYHFTFGMYGWLINYTLQ